MKISPAEARTTDDLVRRLGALLLLIMLDQTMCVQCISYRSTELETYACREPMRRHEGHIHLHLLLRVAISRLAVPGVFVFTLLASFRIQLIWKVSHSENDVLRTVGLAEYSEG